MLYEVITFFARHRAGFIENDRRVDRRPLRRPVDLEPGERHPEKRPLALARFNHGGAQRHIEPDFPRLRGSPGDSA